MPDGYPTLPPNVDDATALCEQFRPFLLGMAGRIHASHPTVEVNDLLQEGRIAILKAARKYDASKGSLLNWIKQPVQWAMQRFARSTARDVRVPDNRFHTVACTMVSMDAPIPTDEGWEPNRLAEILLTDESAVRVGSGHENTHDALHAAIEKLTPNQQYFVRARYFDDLSDAEVAVNTGLSRSEVHRRRSAAELRLRILLAPEPAATKPVPALKPVRRAKPTRTVKPVETPKAPEPVRERPAGHTIFTDVQLCFELVVEPCRRPLHPARGPRVHRPTPSAQPPAPGRTLRGGGGPRSADVRGRRRGPTGGPPAGRRQHLRGGAPLHGRYPARRQFTLRSLLAGSQGTGLDADHHLHLGVGAGDFPTSFRLGERCQRARRSQLEPSVAPPFPGRPLRGSAAFSRGKNPLATSARLPRPRTHPALSMNPTSRLQIIPGDCRVTLPGLPGESVHCVVTSPPYWNLRDYGTGTWEGGDAACRHRRDNVRPDHSGSRRLSTKGTQATAAAAGSPFREVCGLCGARRVDAQIGLEPTPQEYVDKLVGIFRQVRRVMRDDATLWLNLGDTYANDGKWGGATGGRHHRSLHGPQSAVGRARRATSMPDKSLLGIPWMVARALQQPHEHARLATAGGRAWMAGILDGCGEILECDVDRFSFDVFLSVPSAPPDLLARIAAVAGMGSSQEGFTGGWCANATEAADLLAEMYPFLWRWRTEALIAWNLLIVAEVTEGKRCGDYLARQSVCNDLLSRLRDRKQVDLPDWLMEPTVRSEPGFCLRSDIIWHKPNAMPESIGDRPTKAHEYVFLFSKSSRYYYDAAAIAEKAVSDHDSGNGFQGRQGGAVHLPMSGGTGSRNQWTRLSVVEADVHQEASLFEGLEQTRASAPTLRNKRTVWTVATVPSRSKHFAVFPPALIRPCILAGCPLDGTVLDIFAGSGTTGKVAVEEGRQALLLELNPDYLPLIEQRTHTTPGLPLESAA